MWRKKVVVWNQVVDLGPEILLAIAISLLIGLLLGRLTVDREPIVVTAPQNGAERAIVVTNPPIRPIEVKVSCEDRTRTVAEKDTLWRIAESEYGGRGYLYQLIADASGILNPNLIHPHDVLTIPCDLSRLPSSRPVVKAVSIEKKIEASPVSLAKATKPYKTWQEALQGVSKSFKEKGIDLNVNKVGPQPIEALFPQQDPAFLDTTKMPAQPVQNPPQPFLEPYNGLPAVPPEPDHPPNEGIVLPKPVEASPLVVSPSFPSRRVFPRR